MMFTAYDYDEFPWLSATRLNAGEPAKRANPKKHRQPKPADQR